MNKILENQLDYVVNNSNYYQKKFSKYVNSSNKLSNLFESLPFTTKDEILTDQEKQPPFGSNLCVKVKDIRRVHKTSGTTNRPLLIALTENDIKNTVHIGVKCFLMSGLKNSDLVVHCLNYNMWAGGYTDHQSLEATGAAVIPFGVGNSSELIKTILWIKPNVIHCTPSYLAKLEFILKKEFGRQPKELELKLGLFGAESGLQNKKFRENIEKKWGLKAMNANYGMSDVLSMFGAECSYQKGLHFMGNDFLYPELIDFNKEHVLKIEKGVVGELVLTNLYKEAQPLFRYRTNDIVKILSNDSCDCGQRSFRFEVMGRSDDMIPIKGVNVFVNAIERIINNYLDNLTGLYQILINKNEPIDKLLLKMEVKDNKKLSNDLLKWKFINEFKAKIGITPEIKLLKEGTLPRIDGKTQKIFRIL